MNGGIKYFLRLYPSCFLLEDTRKINEHKMNFDTVQDQFNDPIIGQAGGAIACMRNKSSGTAEPSEPFPPGKGRDATAAAR